MTQSGLLSEFRREAEHFICPDINQNLETSCWDIVDDDELFPDPFFNLDPALQPSLNILHLGYVHFLCQKIAQHTNLSHENERTIADTIKLQLTNIKHSKAYLDFEALFRKQLDSNMAIEAILHDCVSWPSATIYERQDLVHSFLYELTRCANRMLNPPVLETPHLLIDDLKGYLGRANGDSNTILLDTSLFEGDEFANTPDEAILTLLHEFGHIIDYGIRAHINAFPAFWHDIDLLDISDSIRAQFEPEYNRHIYRHCPSEKHEVERYWGEPLLNKMKRIQQTTEVRLLYDYS